MIQTIPPNVATLPENSTVTQIKEITELNGAAILPNLVPPDLLARGNASNNLDRGPEA